MDETANLGLPYIMAAQAQKHVTHNEAIRSLDTLVQLSVKDRDLTTPPAMPQNGDCYIVADGGSGDWTDKDALIAAFQDNAWIYYTPLEGWRCWVADEDKLLAWDGTVWSDVSGGGSLNPAPLVGVNTTASAPDRLAVKSDAVLFSHDDVTPGTGDIQAKLNKASAANTASFLFQDNWSGRAEIGLAGDDDFHFKVSPDGSTWREALIIDKDTGAISFPAALYAEAAAFNLMGDGGRFAGSPEPAGVTASTFAKPDWMRATNSAVVSEHGKFYRDSSSYGGSASAIDTDTKQLADNILNSDYRRYYPEFFVAKIAAGSGTSSSIAFPDGTTRYTAVYTENFMRPVAMTFSYYVKVKTGDVGITNWSTQTIYLDGAKQNGHFVVSADGNWYHVLVIETGGFDKHYRYDANSMRFYMRDTHELLMAFPAAIPGRLKLPTNIGQVPGIKAW